MAVIKRAQIPSGTLKLKRLKNDMKELSSNTYKYVVEYPDGDRTDPRFTKQAAMQEWDRVMEVRGSSNSGSSKKKNRGGGLLGGGGGEPSIPSMGGGGGSGGPTVPDLGGGDDDGDPHVPAFGLIPTK